MRRNKSGKSVKQFNEEQNSPAKQARDSRNKFDLMQALAELHEYYPEECQKLTEKQMAFLCIYPEVGLNYAAASRAMGMSRATCYRWMSENETFGTLIKELEEAQLDLVEQRVHQIAMSGAPQALTACIFLLNVKRGYATQTKSTVVHEVKISDPCDLSRYRIEKPQPRDITADCLSE